MTQFSSSLHLTENPTNPEKETPSSSPDYLVVTNTRSCILVVDDDPSVARLLNTVLEDWGYHVLMARNGREGLDMVAKHAVEGILLDMQMPVMDGRTMLDELRWLGYQMPVLAMSGGLDLPALRQLLNEGAQGFFLKPFNLQSLKQSCQQIFDKERTSHRSLQDVYLASSSAGRLGGQTKCP
jgi:two-component system response regulator (stage 0 sporulation protein F)